MSVRFLLRSWWISAFRVLIIQLEVLWRVNKRSTNLASQRDFLFSTLFCVIAFNLMSVIILSILFCKHAGRQTDAYRLSQGLRPVHLELRHERRVRHRARRRAEVHSSVQKRRRGWKKKLPHNDRRRQGKRRDKGANDTVGTATGVINSPAPYQPRVRDNRPKFRRKATCKQFVSPNGASLTLCSRFTWRRCAREQRRNAIRRRGSPDESHGCAARSFVYLATLMSLAVLASQVRQLCFERTKFFVSMLRAKVWFCNLLILV